MHSQKEYRAAENAAIELMVEVCKSSDAMNLPERIVAEKISGCNFSGFQSLTIQEIDDLINLVGYYWGYEEDNASVLIDMLNGYRCDLLSKDSAS
ncbi:hypothetical protein [Serpentinimonas maccroryi]|jgi:hypothetical protein|uniref:hypothetical protein n=1 Tax=Serpentinimonas maccroryi TaxID=1458426 RepID=UPI0020333825|nr:hypothetical protein [Serpentinimonas maccroryi]